MEAHVLLADFAQSESNGKVNALGLGWSVTSTPTPVHSIVLFLRVGWDEANVEHQANLRLLTADGQDAVKVPTPLGEQPLAIQMTFEVGRPPGLPKGSTIDHAMAMTIGGGLPLKPGRYEWRLDIDDVPRDEWRAAFTVRA